MNRLRGLLASIVGIVIVGVSLLAATPAQAFIDKDCGDFATQADAQAFYLNSGGPAADPHRLDAEGDGLACETLPCPCSYSSPQPAPPAPLV